MSYVILQDRKAPVSLISCVKCQTSGLEEKVLLSQALCTLSLGSKSSLRRKSLAQVAWHMGGKARMRFSLLGQSFTLSG